MALSYEGWLFGITATCVVIYSCIFGFFLIYKSKSSNAPLLMYAGLAIMSAGLTYLGIFWDFLTILITGYNMNLYWRVVVGYIWWSPCLIFGMYIVAELQIPEKKRYFISFYVILGVIIEIFFLFDPWSSFTFKKSGKTGENISDPTLKFGSPAYIYFVFFFFPMLYFLVLDFYIKAFKQQV